MRIKYLRLTAYCSKPPFIEDNFTASNLQNYVVIKNMTIKALTGVVK